MLCRLLRVVINLNAYGINHADVRAFVSVTQGVIGNDGISFVTYGYPGGPMGGLGESRMSVCTRGGAICAVLI